MCNYSNQSSRNKVSIIARRQWNYYLSMNTVYFSLANEIHAKIFFVDILIARNCIIPSFSFEKSLKSDPQDPLLRWKGREPCVFIISLHLDSSVALSLYALETWSLRDVSLSFTHDTRVFHMIIRSLASPSVYSFSHLDPRLGLPKHAHPHMHTSHPRLWLRPWYSEAVHSRIWYSSQIESTRLWLLPWYSDALHPLLWLHPQIASTRHQTFGSSHRYLGPNGTLGEWDSALPRRSEKSALVPRNIGEHGLTNFNVKTSVVRHEVAPATVTPHL